MHISAFRVGFVITAIPVVALSILSTAGGAGEYDPFHGSGLGLYTVWYVAAAAWVAAFLASLGSVAR